MYVYTTIKKLVLPKNEIKSPQVLWEGLLGRDCMTMSLENQVFFFFHSLNPLSKKLNFGTEKNSVPSEH